MTHWFTADPHFGHEAIIRFCARPFHDVDMMDAHILHEYRARVGPDDDLWIVGDFAFGDTDDRRKRAARIFDAIPGRKHLILGNHDRPWIRNLPWDSVAPTADIGADGRRVFLAHYPMITFPGARRKAIQLFGHVHGNWLGTRNSVNVGVDVWNFRPVSIPEITERAAGLAVNGHWDEVEPGCAFPSTRCMICSARLDPQLTRGHAIRQGDAIVVAPTGELIAIIEESLSWRVGQGEHVCPDCLEAFSRTSDGFRIPEGFEYDWQSNRSRPVPGDHGTQ